MKQLIFSLIFVFSFVKISYSQQVFHSSHEYNDFVFKKTNLPYYTTGYLLDRDEEHTPQEIDSIITMYNSDDYSTEDLIAYLQMLERTDVSKKFEKDSILFPVMNHLYSNTGKYDIKIPLYVLDFDFSRIDIDKKNEMDKMGTAYPKLKKTDFLTTNLFCSAFFISALTLNDQTKFYWDANTVKTNTNKLISSISLTTINGTIILHSGELADLRSILGINGNISKMALQINYVDGKTKTVSTNLNLNKSDNTKKLIIGFPTDEEKYWDDWGSLGKEPTLNYHIKYGCGNDRLIKPYFMVAGFGPFTDKWLINWAQGWPTGSLEMLENMNLGGIVDGLLSAGYDIVLVQFAPPNADIRLNADRLEELINKINNSKSINGSSQENIIHGVSAGALCTKLTLQRMEKKHLDQNGSHPHTKLFVSFDGENQGANIPLGNQHCVWYLDEFQSGLKNYALHYILNADLSKQLLKYFYTETGTEKNPKQGHHPMRDYYLWEHAYANHAKNTHLSGYPSFNRNISITNGSNTPDITGKTSNNFPYPKTEGYTLFAQENSSRKWKASLNGRTLNAGEHRVFLYEKYHAISTKTTSYNFVTDDKCLVLDNAPGGTVIGSNPLLSTMEVMDAEIIGKADIYKPNTLFNFTPTIFTLDIRNFDPVKSNYRLDYNLKLKGLMYQSKTDYLALTPSDIYGYPHLAFPYSHYWEVTPFDAVFSWSKNNEHLTFNEATKTNGGITNDDEPWRPYYPDYMGDIFKIFILEEADYQSAYVQNKQYGWNARDNYVYTAEIKVPKTICAGQEVTQKTDFKVVEILKNADITFQAGEFISLMPGFQVKAGGVFHAIIRKTKCNNALAIKAIPSVNTVPALEEDNNEFTQMIEKPENIKVYPNPATGEISIQLPDHIDTSIEKGTFSIYDLQGKLHESGELENRSIPLSIKEGVYLIKVKHNNYEYTEKLIVR